MIWLIYALIALGGLAVSSIFIKPFYQRFKRQHIYSSQRFELVKRRGWTLTESTIDGVFSADASAEDAQPSRAQSRFVFCTHAPSSPSYQGPSDPASGMQILRVPMPQGFCAMADPETMKLLIDNAKEDKFDRTTYGRVNAVLHGVFNDQSSDLQGGHVRALTGIEALLNQHTAWQGVEFNDGGRHDIDAPDWPLEMVFWASGPSWQSVWTPEVAKRWHRFRTEFQNNPKHKASTHNRIFSPKHLSTVYMLAGDQQVRLVNSGTALLSAQEQELFIDLGLAFARAMSAAEQKI